MVEGLGVALASVPDRPRERARNSNPSGREQEVEYDSIAKAREGERAEWTKGMRSGPA